MTAMTAESPGPMSTATRLKLSVMMFLEFFVWGAWFVTMGTFLATSLTASGSQISLAYLTQSLGAIAAPFIIGLIADQFFSAQKVLGILHLAGAALLFWASTMETFGAFFPVILAYMILYMPTLALVNSVSFRQMSNPEKQFPAVRVLGTIGWIVAGLFISFGLRGLVAGRLLDLRERELLEPGLVLDEVAAGLAPGPLLGGEHRLVERDERLQPLDLVLLERPQHPRGRALAVAVPHDELGDHRVVHRRDLAARAHARVDAHAGPGGLLVGADLAGGGSEVLRGVLRVDAALDGVPAQDDVLLRDAQRLARRGEDALAHDVDAGDQLGHRVLDLDPGVHLEEEVLAVLEQALDRARAAVVDGLGRVGGHLADVLAQLGVDGGRRRLLDELLVAALDGAVALAEVDDVAVRVGEHLDLDVARVGEVALEVDGRVGEELLALARGALEGGLQLVLGERDAEALAAPAARGLDRDRVADLVLGDARGRLEVGHGLGRAGHDRDAGRLHELARAGLGPHRLDRAGRRADEGDALVLQALHERCVLGEEAVAGVDGLGAGLADDTQDAVDVEVALGRRRGAEQVGLGGPLDVQGVAIELRVHGDRRDPELVERADDADGYLAAIGDQDLREHGRGS